MNPLEVVRFIDGLADAKISPFNAAMDKLLRCAISRMGQDELLAALHSLKATDVSFIAHARNMVVARLDNIGYPIEPCTAPFCTLCKVPLTEEEFMRLIGAPTLPGVNVNKHR